MRFLLLGLITFLFVHSLPAVAGDLSVSWDNDLLTGDDKGYTNGLRLSWLSPSAETDNDCVACLPLRGRNLLTPLPGIGSPRSRHALAWSVQQMMITPEDIEAEPPRSDDLPYVGYLSGNVALWSWDARHITGYGIVAGIVGPDSGAENVQRWVHKVTGSKDPSGWGYQLGNRKVLGAFASHGHRLFRETLPSGRQQELAYTYGVHASGFQAVGNVGAIWRTGRALPRNFIPDYSGASSTIGMPGLTAADGEGWSFFIGMGVDYYAYSYLEEHSGPFRFNQSSTVAQFGMGAGWHRPDVHVAVVLRANSSPEERNKEPLTFGTVSVAWRL